MLASPLTSTYPPPTTSLARWLKEDPDALVVFVDAADSPRIFTFAFFANDYDDMIERAREYHSFHGYNVHSCYLSDATSHRPASMGYIRRLGHKGAQNLPVDVKKLIAAQTITVGRPKNLTLGEKDGTFWLKSRMCIERWRSERQTGELSVAKAAPVKTWSQRLKSEQQ